MKELPKNYEPQKYEKDIYEKWEKSGAFTPKIDHKKRPFVIPMPPPNVTGILHVGHASMLAYQDILTRWHRMLGQPTLWYPGTDHAAIATQEVVERKIKNETGKNRYEIGREKMLEEIKKFAENSRHTILSQIKIMGASCDWTRLKYTMDETSSKAVQEIFIRMHKDGMIYRGDRVVNWCPRCNTTLANDEIEHKDIDGHLYHIKYRLQNDPGKFIEIATTRPETMFGDSAIAVHPQDKKWKNLIGQTVFIPIINREIPIITDEYVDINFGSGALKITPAHDPNDFEIGKRHQLKSILAIDEKGFMTDEAGKYKGLDRFICRENLLRDLEKSGELIEIKKYSHAVGHCGRCKTVVEPRLSKQWFVSVTEKIPGRNKSLQEYCQEFIRAKKIKIIPKRFEKQYFNWVDNFRDWCISRQIWWGHRIPVWYRLNSDVLEVYKRNPNEFRQLIENETNITVSIENPEKDKPADGSKNEHWVQDPDTLDTWFSSGCWTFGPHGWPDETEDLKYFTPPNAEVVMETYWDILTLWVVRMNLMTAYALDEIPYQTVYLHGAIVDKNNKKMSKSRPETCIDPRDIIEKHGADVLRLSLIIGSAPGAQLALAEEKIIGCRNFITKIWNVARFIIEQPDFETAPAISESKTLSTSQRWILSCIEDLKKHSKKSLKSFHFSAYGEALYDFLWNSFADWYLEISKIETGSTPILKEVLKNFLILAHPIIPFVTEKIWQEAEFTKTQLISETWPEFNKKLIDQKAQAEMNKIQAMIKAIRSARAEAKINAGAKIKTIIEANTNKELFTQNIGIIKKLSRCEEISFSNKKPTGNIFSFMAGTDSAHIIMDDLIDSVAEKTRLNKEVNEIKLYITGLEAKLNNKKFIKNAPKEVVSKEKEKLEQAKLRLEKLDKQIKTLS
ncbi:MAG: valine--tRNA ligase [Patescibacteria group bacterium]|nr:valine--tRNA ligase [Patescibacteria group bacterium]